MSSKTPDDTLKGISMFDITSDKEEHCQKACSPIEVTLLGMVMDVSPLQLLKAPSPMETMLLGMFIDLRLLQSEKAQFPMDITLLGIFIDVRASQ